MKPRKSWSQAFLQAAEAIASERETYSCIAIYHAAGNNYEAPLIRWYQENFRPDGDSVRWSVDIECNGGANLRVMMLTLAAAICSCDGEGRYHK